ncbi:ribonuclease III [Limnoraphis robusta]|uniref:Ribonuclease 3 n=1 Tax=Limnoraphis robusta CCNP1315 TaxID=3110306 RepID=A0ABU5TTN5_9CYAN|nr:ribonuclease III [Limnoraphis robusta]MEA5518258.1 ribonuclease III [Limnoraphis robusta CCNP1315]MEA5547448.1 ribonuclease III [Limnoraphis robusta CCNP1324]
MINSRDRIGRCLDLLKQGLYPYFEQCMRDIYGNQWLSQAEKALSKDATLKRTFEDTLKEDISVILNIINKRWEKVFKPHLSSVERALVSELIDVRNKWAHQVTFSTEDTYRALDSMSRLLNTIGAAEQETLINQHKQEILKRLLKEQSRPDQSQISGEESSVRERLKELLEKIPFQDARLLKRALTHRTYVFENPTQTQGDNEQLEFLGDSVLNFLAGDYLYEQYSHRRDEGELTRRRSNLVDNSQFAQFAIQLNLGEWMQLGKGEELQGGRTKSSLLSNTFEAVIGAYYLDSGIEAVRELIKPFFESVDTGTVDSHIPQQNLIDPKGRLQNIAQTNNLPLPEYVLVDETGNDHDKTFEVQVIINGEFYGEGTGKKKKEAEKQAAIDALRRLDLL